jgi:uncharacterized protein (DUF983 family)
VTYRGTSDPGNRYSGVFNNCPNLRELKLPDNYLNEEFCGLNVEEMRSKEKPEGGRTGIIVASVIGAVVLIAAVIAIVFYIKKQKQYKENIISENFIVP